MAGHGSDEDSAWLANNGYSLPNRVPAVETDQIKVDGKDVVLQRKMQIPAAGTPVAYRFIVRGSAATRDPNP